MMKKQPCSDVPLTIIAGYLGAGKTTLINHLLLSNHGLRLAVLVNDFGSLNIDAGLIESHEGNTYSLTNGCVCCTIADDLGITLKQLLAAEDLPGHIILEASGVAEPAKLAIYGAGWPGLSLQAVLVVIDAETIQQRSRDKFVGGLVLRQMAAADLLLINKVDLIDELQHLELRDWLNKQGFGAGLVEMCHGVLPPEILFTRQDFSTYIKPNQYLENNHSHQEIFFSFVIEDDRPWDRQKLTTALELMPSALVRAKGRVFLADDPMGENILQRVGRRWTIERRASQREDAPVTQLVLIGIKEGVDPNEITRQLMSCAQEEIN